MTKGKIIIILLSILSMIILYSNNPIFPKTDKKPVKEVKEKTLPVEKAEKIKEEPNNRTENDKAEGTSLYHTVKRGGPLMIFLIMLGVLSLTIITERIIYFSKYKVWDRKTLELYIKKTFKKSKAHFREDKEEELKESLQLYVNRLERGMAFLSGIGNLSPIVGFLGTVIGMIAAFAAIAAATTVNAKVVAVGIQVALITTAGGLIIAAPTLLFYYLFSHIIQNRYTQAEALINNLCSGLPRLSDQLKDSEDNYAEETYEENFE